MIKKILAFLVLIIYASQNPIVYSQFSVSYVTRPDNTPGNINFNKAEKLAFQAYYDSAITIYQKVKTEFVNTKDWEGVADCYNRMGDAYKEIAEFDSALSSCKRAMEIASKKLRKNTPSLIRIYNSIGFVYWNMAEYDSSWSYYNKALAITHREDDPEIAKTYFYFALYYRAKGQYGPALEYHIKALNLRLKILGPSHIDVAQSYHAMGVLYSKKDDYDNALIYLEKALAIKLVVLNSKHPSLALTYNSMGIISLAKTDVVSSIDYFNKALNISIRAYGEDHPDVALFYDNLGLIYGYQGDYYRSVEYHQKALDIRQRLYGETFDGHIRSYKLIGSAYQLTNEFEKAVNYYNKALSLSIKLFGGMDTVSAECYEYFGPLYSSMGDHDKAIEEYNKALELFLKAEPMNLFEVAYCYRCIGVEYYKKSNSEKALENFYKTLNMYTAIYQTKNLRIGEAFNDIGGVYLMLTQPKTALVWIQKAIITLVTDFNDTSIYSNPALKKILWNQELLISLKFKAESLEKFYELESHDLKDLQMSLSTYELAAELTDKIRQGYKSENSKLSLAAESNLIYEKAILLCLKLFSQTNNDLYKNKAFIFAEKSKSAILRESLADLSAKSFASIPDSLLEKERILKIDLAFYETRLQKAITDWIDSIKYQSQESKLFALKYDYESLIRNFEINYPAYHQLKYEKAVVSVEEIQRSQLDSDQVILEYFLSEKCLVAYTISKDRFQVQSLPKDSSIELAVRTLRKSLVNLEPNEYAVNASKLYQWLIHPVAGEIKGYKKLMIIPDGILNYLPFEALLTKEVNTGPSPDFTVLPYLVKDYQISYNYSLTLLTHRLDNSKKNSFLGIAPVFTDSMLSGISGLNGRVGLSKSAGYPDLFQALRLNEKTISSLPYTESEVKDIGRLFDSHQYKNSAFLYDQATEKIFKSGEAERYKFIHIASHGFINESNPKLSGIIFSPGDSTDDGILYADEIYNLSLSAELVVLSACESGLGKIVKGEGIMSLTRGFIYSGAKNVIVSLWQVRDKSTAVLMKYLYEGVLNGQTYTEALQQAQLRLIRNPKYAYPLDWSPFILIGH